MCCDDTENEAMRGAFFSKFLSINIFYKIHHKENHPDLVPVPPLTFLITSHHHFSSVLIYRWWAWLAWFRRTLHDAKCSSIGSISRGKRKCWGQRGWGFSQFQSCSRRDAPKIVFVVRILIFAIKINFLTQKINKFIKKLLTSWM